MNSGSSPLVTTLVLIMAGLVIIQTFQLIIMFLQVKRGLQTLETRLQTLSRQVSTGLTSAGQVLEKLEPIGPTLADLEKIIALGLDILVELARKGDEVVADRLSFLRSQSHQASQILAKLLNQFSKKTFELNHMVVHHAFQASAIIRAVRAALTRLTSPDRTRSPATYVPDQEIFI